MRYNHRNYTSVFSNIICILYKKFWAIPFPTSRDMTIKIILGKTELQCSRARNVHINSTNSTNFLKIRILYIYFTFSCILFHCKPKHNYQNNFGTNRIAASPRETCFTKNVPLFFLIAYILYINFREISFNRSRDLHIPKNLENVWLQRHLLNDFHQNLIDTNLC